MATTRYKVCDFVPHSDRIAQRAVSRMLAGNPLSVRKSADAEAERLHAECKTHLEYLAEAIAADSPQLFRSYAGWYCKRSTALNGGEQSTVASFTALASALEADSGSRQGEVAANLLRDAVSADNEAAGTDDEPFVEADSLAVLLLEALLACRQFEAIRLMDAARDDGMPLLQIYLDVFQPVLREVGRLWQSSRISVAQEHYCSAAIQLMMGRLGADIFSTERNGYTAVAACVGAELHEIGMRMAADALALDGWDTRFLGANVPTQDLVAMLKQERTDVVCLSVTLTLHLSRAYDVIQAIRGEPSLARTKIVVGGYPFNCVDGLWRRVGADGYAADAASAVSECSRLVAT